MPSTFGSNMSLHYLQKVVAGSLVPKVLGKYGKSDFREKLLRLDAT